jgi:nucleotide-binding universal stress UspA family protein
MVHVDADADTDHRVRLAAELADRFGSTLIGAAALTFPPALAESGDIVGGVVLLDRERELDEVPVRLAECEKRFRALVSHKEASRVAWRSSLENPTEFLVRQARAADLLVIGRDRASGGEEDSVDPATVLLKAGRPVLTVPPSVASLSVRRVVVGWKDTREARRAVRDAIPLLTRASEVVVAEIYEDNDQSDAHRNIEDVADYLSRHRVIVTAKIATRATTTAGRELVRVAKDEGADLIVTGAYGHSRLGEWVFGGVTRELMRSAPVCCLFAH